MSSLIRLHIDAPLAEGGKASISRAQVHYLKTVMRRGEGDPLVVFNARDGEFAATIESLGGKGGVVAAGARRRAPEPEPDLWLAFAPVKRGAVDFIVQKGTELGAARFLPTTTARTNAARVREDRLAAIACEAAEQCGRLSVPAVAPLRPLAAMLDEWPAGRRLMYCDEAGDAPDEEWGGRAGRAAPALEALKDAPAGPWAILIGPEGGFAPEERARLRRLDFVTPVTLGPRILRADTAAIAALTLWQAALGDLRRV
ncbi:16S rRNA (uracil(1498)-N(3))-methyltransferase [Amphiplicatus metriothermophilus]|uniref:Ribosomal RNA small subunit methyltransferase E n=1 Tax=Amphiplicatus metriothermophilus TaxID=1519374 RepID=A0A239PV59_9PROT|nr:16S rRNA (uracil(1498)-N(3))-methyltransferase [Amphiplicatus metriothermophilus]MBB5519581.1 16S rRNA (uracil1498-N3)-methyltransferase [Amphiplicatus metriothermophilus]SNT74145.1 16S rRNA (uracil1498-N3)-methyltransferase [Amphiplicatus metriothermophilus]